MLVLLRKYWLRGVALVTLLTLRLLLRRWTVLTCSVRLLTRVCWRMDLRLVREVLLSHVYNTNVSMRYGGTYRFLTMVL